MRRCVFAFDILSVSVLCLFGQPYRNWPLQNCLRCAHRKVFTELIAGVCEATNRHTMINIASQRPLTINIFSARAPNFVIWRTELLDDCCIFHLPFSSTKDQCRGCYESLLSGSQPLFSLRIEHSPIVKLKGRLA